MLTLLFWIVVVILIFAIILEFEIFVKIVLFVFALALGLSLLFISYNVSTISELEKELEICKTKKFEVEEKIDYYYDNSLVKDDSSNEFISDKIKLSKEYEKEIEELENNIISYEKIRWLVNFK